MSNARTLVFLSYCHDNKAEVTKLRDELIAAGIDVWWDEDILAGQKITAAIRDALKRAAKLVLCLSKETEARHATGIYPEARDAIEILRSQSPDASFIIPVRLSECRIPPFEIDASTHLDDLLCVDLFPPSKRNDGIQRLLKALP